MKGTQIKQKINGLIKNWFFWLIIVTSISVILRSLPAWTNAAWGCDFGIYYGLTESLVKNMDLFNPYYGWGSSYQYFPVLYAVTAVFHWITGLDVIVIMPKIAPIFGGLSVLIFYFVVYELIGSRKTALLSSLFLAVMPFHVYQTSHASPLTMGHFFMMLSMYLFIKYRRDIRYIVPLLASTILLIMSHHLTTYFYLIILIFVVFIENASRKKWTTTLGTDVFYILTTSVLVFSYWIFVATTVYKKFMETGFRIGSIHIGSNYIIALFYILFLSLFGIIWLKRRYNLFPKKKKPTINLCLMRFSLTFITCLIAMSIFSVTKMPWTNFSFTPLSIAYSVPLLLMFGFGAAGFQYTRFIRNGGFIRGWFLAILLSFMYGLMANKVILPHRHFEYMMAPLSIIAVYGIRGIFLNLDYKSLLGRLEKIINNVIHLTAATSYSFSRRMRWMQKRQIIYVFVVIVLITTNAVSVYPSHVALNASYEAITDSNLAAIEWIRENLDRNTSVIASDHRLARMAEAVGFNTTLDEAIIIWKTENLTDYIDELRGSSKDYSRITHVIVDDIMKNRVVHVGFGKIVYMTNESYEKFLHQPFELLYRNSTVDQNMVEIHWTEVYAVNWTFIEEKLEKKMV
ncbi:MAG: hypothetical protein DRN08_00105 [Thermoplasmata archaeon]|nr:MAG: hypothetical protein DRN08_00105 [Thermoplasmata archaeon]